MNEQNDAGSNTEVMKPFLRFLGGIGGRILLTVIFAAVFYGLMGLLLHKGDDTVLWIFYIITIIQKVLKHQNKLIQNMLKVKHGHKKLISI